MFKRMLVILLSITITHLTGCIDIEDAGNTTITDTDSTTKPMVRSTHQSVEKDSASTYSLNNISLGLSYVSLCKHLHYSNVNYQVHHYSNEGIAMLFAEPVSNNTVFYAFNFNNNVLTSFTASYINPILNESIPALDITKLVDDEIQRAINHFGEYSNDVPNEYNIDILARITGMADDIDSYYWNDSDTIYFITYSPSLQQCHLLLCTLETLENSEYYSNLMVRYMLNDSYSWIINNERIRSISRAPQVDQIDVYNLDGITLGSSYERLHDYLDINSCNWTSKIFVEKDVVIVSQYSSSLSLAANIQFCFQNDKLIFQAIPFSSLDDIGEVLPVVVQSYCDKYGEYLTDIPSHPDFQPLLEGLHYADDRKDFFWMSEDAILYVGFSMLHECGSVKVCSLEFLNMYDEYAKLSLNP